MMTTHEIRNMASQVLLPHTLSAWRKFSAVNPMARIYYKIGARNGDRIPADLHGDFEIDGWIVRVLRSKEAREGGKGRGAPRVFINVNGHWVPAGRMAQVRPKQRPGDYFSRLCTALLKIGDDLESAAQDLKAFGAPSECFADLNRNVGANALNVLHEYGYSFDGFVAELIHRTSNKYFADTFGWLEPFILDEQDRERTAHVMRLARPSLLKQLSR